MSFLSRTDNIACENFGTETTRNVCGRHKKRCSVRTPNCADCPTCSTSQADLNYHIAKKRSLSQPKKKSMFVSFS